MRSSPVGMDAVVQAISVATSPSPFVRTCCSALVVIRTVNRIITSGTGMSGSMSVRS